MPFDLPSQYELGHPKPEGFSILSASLKHGRERGFLVGTAAADAGGSETRKPADPSTRDALATTDANHSPASALTAVKNRDVYRGGPLYRGPITNFVLTERTANPVYDGSKRLFDPQRIADIVQGKAQ